MNPIANPTAVQPGVPLDLTIDCDPGIDDAIALSYLAGEAVAGRAVLRHVLAVRGNVGAAQTARNAAFMLDRLGLNQIPVSRGAATPITPLDAELDATAFHGADGLGGLHDPTHPDRSMDAGVAAIAGILGAAVGPHATILAVGPLTNLANAFRLRPGLAAAIGRLVVMGGAFGAPRGNITPHAEYNFYADAGAAAEVLSSGVSAVVVPLDVTEQVLIRERDLGQMRTNPRSAFVADLLRASIAIHNRQMGLDGCIMHDALAAAIALHPELVTTRSGTVTVEIEGDRLGNSNFVEGPGSVAVAFEVDSGAAREVILDSLGRL